MPVDCKLEGRLLRIVLNRPEKRNALDLETCRDVTAALTKANDDPAVGAVLLAATGKAFCAGMDLNEIASPEPLAEAHERLFTANEWMLKPLIAAVQGPALGGGTGLVANAHIVVASEEATFGLTELRLGLWPVLIYPAIVRAMGERRALELSLSARIFHARDAEWYGLVNEVVTVDRLATRAIEIAGSVAASSASALRTGMSYVREIRGKSTAEALQIGRMMRGELMSDPDFTEGVAAFREKRPPVWPSHQ